MSDTWKKNTIIFLASQIISLFGSSLVQYAISWYIVLETQSGSMMTISIICGFLPTFFLAPFAGVWADRYNRKLLIILADSLIAISTLIMAILFFIGYNAIWMLFIISAIRAIGSGIQSPAIGAFLPQIVPGDKLTKVHAINGSIQSVIMIISPMLSGTLLSFAKIELIFFIDVITAAIAVFALTTLLKVPAHKKALEKQKVSYFEDMKEGVLYIREHKFLKIFFIFCAFFNILAAPCAFLTPLQVTRTFGDDVWRLTAIEIAFFIGMMSGGAIIASWGGFKNKIHTMTIAFLLIGGCTFFLGVIPNFFIYLLIMAFVGISIPMFNTPATVLLQRKVDENFLGRIFGVLSMISSVMMPMGMLIFGPLADIVKIEWLLVISGSLLLVQSIFLLKSKTLLEAGIE